MSLDVPAHLINEARRIIFCRAGAWDDHPPRRKPNDEATAEQNVGRPTELLGCSGDQPICNLSFPPRPPVAGLPSTQRALTPERFVTLLTPTGRPAWRPAPTPRAHLVGLFFFVIPGKTPPRLSHLLQLGLTRYGLDFATSTLPRLWGGSTTLDFGPRGPHDFFLFFFLFSAFHPADVGPALEPARRHPIRFRYCTAWVASAKPWSKRKTTAPPCLRLITHAP